jgi:microcystin-dependent protein
MNQINTLQYPTINGLKSLQLDNLTTDVLNAKNMFLESLEVADIIVDSKLEIGDDAVIETNGLEISNEELSYLDGATSNIQSQISANTNKLTAISYTGDTNVNSNLNVTGELSLIDDVDTSKRMKIHWVPTHNGHWFETLNNGAYIYFIVKNMLGNIRAFQFNYDLVYSSIPFFCDGNFSMGTQQFIQGTNGSSIQFIGSGNPGDGWTHKVTQNNYYINWWCRNSGGTDINVFRMHNTKISSFIAHEFLDNISMNSTTNTNRQITASYHNFSSSTISTPTYVSRIYATSGVSDTAMLFEQTSSSFSNTTYQFFNKIGGTITTILQLAGNVILGAPLQFADATVQTTAMTTSYLTGVIQSVAGAMTSLLNPVGSVIAFAGSSAPSGWLLCQGQLISKTTYASLWAIIGDTYLNGRSADASNFYIPDLREFYIKGAGQNFTDTKKYTYSGGNALATFLDQEVLPHYHTYTDKGDGSVNRASGPNGAANDNTRTNNTNYAVYHPDGTVMASNENRPQTLVLNYIIKH